MAVAVTVLVAVAMLMVAATKSRHDGTCSIVESSDKRQQTGDPPELLPLSVCVWCSGMESHREAEVMRASVAVREVLQAMSRVTLADPVGVCVAV